MTTLKNTKGHVFAFHNLLQGEDLIASEFYKDKQIEAIIDPEGGNTKKLPTSIPSPFAIIDLTASAFNILSKSNNLMGNAIYEKIVSQCWDVGMMFFNNLGLDKKLEIIEWKREEEIEKLLKSSLNGHRILGQTLQMYLEDDALAYNFDGYKSAYILKYNHNFFGGTSPKTLFYATLNPLEDDPENHINLGDNDILFDKQYAPLYKRPEDFQLYIYSLVKKIDRFSSRCKELRDYLNKNKEILRIANKPLFDRIEALTEEHYDKNYKPTSVGSAGSYVSVLGVPIRCKPPKEDGHSDFKIKTTKFQGKKPLVLFPGFGGQTLFGSTMTYFDCDYSKEIDDGIGFYDTESDINNRHIPGLTGIKYPCLYVDDLLEDTLFKSSYEINRDHFFSGNFNGEDVGYFLPIKKELFKYFDASDLIDSESKEGSPFFKLEERANGAIKAILKIPIQSGHMTFEKMYLPSGAINRDKNVGIIKAMNLDVNIFPFIKYDPVLEMGSTQGEENEFRTHFLFQRMIKTPKISFVKNNGKVLSTKVSNLKGNSAIEGFQTHITNQYYDYIHLSLEDKNVLILPIWMERTAPSGDFHFAIDFGTTNTHIEYKKNDGEAKVFEMSSYLGSLSSQSVLHKDRANKEFIPEQIGPETNFRFTQRTIIAATKTLDYRKPTQAMADFRIPFYYEYEDHTSTSDYHSNLKWANYAVDQQKDGYRNPQESQVSAFIEQLILMMKAKVLSEEGILKNTRFTWFYPSSMTNRRIGSLKKFWIELLEKHFGVPRDYIKSIPESIAPFAYYLANEGIDSLLYPAVTIDIGGGTSDMVVFKEDRPSHLTSFRFAGNSIFGDGYNSNVQKNGFVIKYKNAIKDLLETNKLSKLEGALKSIKEGNSADIITFFMSLENNLDVQNKHNISFQKLLSNDATLKTVILLFYHALIYHLASYLKKAELEMPGVLVFSGKGGNLIKLLDDSFGYSILSEYTVHVFDGVYGEKHTRSINIILSDKPKAVTCKGGLEITDSLIGQGNKISKIITGAKKEPINLPKYPQLVKSSPIVKSVIREVKDALKQFFDLNDKFNYYHNFEINAGALKLAKKLLMEEGVVDVGVLKGVNERQKELGDNKNIEIEETLFFYPYNDLLNKLAYRLVVGK